VPVVYGYVARNTRSPEYIAHLIDRLRAGAHKPPAPSASEEPSP
jgi:multidrug efflux pump